MVVTAWRPIEYEAETVTGCSETISYDYIKSREPG
jgi:hypothetical protein